ncbi:MAG TPA: LysM peptidoglycan-binding domain-containing M23 family metallopeptidase [bacterium]|nr:LysM peptidoglycan-binding domain-containing M23 family metallopeptidase [bacterium]
MIEKNARLDRKKEIPTRKHELLEDPKAGDIFRQHFSEFHLRTAASWFKQLFCLIFSCLFVGLMGKFLSFRENQSGRRFPNRNGLIFRFFRPITDRLEAWTVSSTLVFIACISIGILVPPLGQSGEESEDNNLGALLLPPGMQDTISEDDGYEDPQSAVFAEPPPSDFDTPPIPSLESYTFEPSNSFAGTTSEESVSYIAKTSEQLSHTQVLPDLPELMNVDEVPKKGSSGQAAETPETTAGDAPVENEAFVRHVVLPGENPWQICVKYKVKMEDLIALNNIGDPSRLKPGLELIIPTPRLPGASLSFRYPLEEIVINSGYGMRTHPILRKQLFHRGIDFQAKKGTSVYAAADGIVIFARRSGGKGNTVVIDHQNGYKSLYAHLMSMSVKTGQRVKQGQRIAKSGSTGRATGPHLHFEVWDSHKHINPLYVLPPLPGTEAYSQK